MSASQKKQTDKDVDAAFTSYYLQRATQEFAEDLDKVRSADDFKSDSVAMLVHALQQGTSLFSADEKRKIVSAAADADEGSDEIVEKSN
jgi:ribosome assembly protein 3